MSARDHSTAPIEAGAIDEWRAAPVPPRSMSSDEVNETRAHAVELVRAVRDSAGGRQLAALDEVGGVGVESQRNAGRQLELVKTRLGTFLDEGGASKAVATDLMQLRNTLDRINPHLEKHDLRRRLAASIPFLRDNVMVRTLKKIALRYEPVARQVTIIEAKLREGRALLARDNIELRRLYDDVEAQQEVIVRQIFLGELLLQDLDWFTGEVDDPLERDRVQSALHDVAVRVQDLRAMQEVHLQYLLSIELTRQNNNRLGQAVDRTVTMATNTVTVGLAIQAALVRERAVRDATQRTREFLGEVVVQNAAAIRQQTEDIGDLYNQPVIALDKLAEAHRDLIAALDAASRLREQGIVTARSNIEALAELTNEMVNHLERAEGGVGTSA